MESRFKPTIVADVRKLRYPFVHHPIKFDVVLASPPCTAFSVASIRWHWKDHTPDRHVSEGLGLVACTLGLISMIRPQFWVMENPRGMLRTIIGRPRETILLCAFGAPWPKPTDLWGRWPGILRRKCEHGEMNLGIPRGSQSGALSTLARNPSERAELPYGLSEELCKRFEEA